MTAPSSESASPLFSSLEDRDPIILLRSLDETLSTEKLSKLASVLGRPFHCWFPSDDDDNLFSELEELLQQEGAIVLATDLDRLLHQPRFARAMMRWAKEGKGSTLVALTASLSCAPALRPYCRFLEMPPLTIPETIERIVNGLQRAGWTAHTQIPDRSKRMATLVRLLHGMKLVAMDRLIERIASRAPLLDDDAVALVYEARTEQLRNLKFLSLINPLPNPDDLAGLENLTSWLDRQNKLALYASEKTSIPAPRGMLLVGVPGCGKSLAAQVCASMFSVPLLRLEFGILRTAEDGAENVLLRCLDEATRAAPCVLWLDEIDHALGGADTRSENRGLVGTLASWLQERERPVFVAATANDVSCLPPELVRKGRFDEIFFVDLPTKAERLAIMRVHLTKLGHEVDFSLDPLVDETRQFTGAEVAAVAREATLQSVLRKEPLQFQHLMDAAQALVPLVRTYEKEIKELRNWARFRARSASENMGILELFEK